MSRCSEQKQQQKKWEPLPLPMVDESLCFSTTVNAPASWTRRWMMQVFSLTPWTRPLCGKQHRLQVWCHLADAWAEANITRRTQSSQDWPITKPLAFHSHLCASLLQGPAPIVSRPRRRGCSSSDFKSRFSWFWSTFSLAAISLSSRRCWYGYSWGDGFPPASRLGASDVSGAVWAGSRNNVSYGVNSLKTPRI